MFKVEYIMFYTYKFAIGFIIVVVVLHVFTLLENFNREREK